MFNQRARRHFALISILCLFGRGNLAAQEAAEAEEKITSDDLRLGTPVSDVNLTLSSAEIQIDFTVLEVYTGRTIDRQTAQQIEKLMSANKGRPDGRVGKFKATKVVDLLQPAFEGAPSSSNAKKSSALEVGYSEKLPIQGDGFKALTALLAKRGYARIAQNSVIEKVEQGKTADVSAHFVFLPDETVRYYKLTELGKGNYWRLRSLEVTPYRRGKGAITLQTKAVVSTYNAVEVGSKRTVLERTIELTGKEASLKPGEGLIIRGIRNTEVRTMVRGVPLLRDAPIIGRFFRWAGSEERRTDIFLIMRAGLADPNVSGGAPDYKRDRQKERSWPGR